jgi:DNA polymerase-3 subunit epsilon
MANLTWACTFEATGLSLIDLVEALEIKAQAHHDALNDAHMCAEVYLKLQMGIVPNTNKITPKPAKSLFDGHAKLTGDVLRPNLQNADPSSPFYAKKVVFTGVLTHISREDAAAKVKLLGADIDTGISSRTDLVIVGKGAGPVKLKKIDTYNGEGAHIRVVNEREFLGMIGFKVD